MVAIPFPLSTSPGEYPQEGAGRLINAYAVPNGKDALSEATWKRVPGLTRFSTSTETGFRGMLQVVSTLYFAVGTKVFKVDSTGGAATEVDTLAGSAKCFWARNNKAGTPDIVVVDPDEGCFTVDSSSVIDFADTDLPQPCDVCFQSGYFFFAIGDGRCFASGLNAVTIDANDYVTAESQPDGLLRVIPFNDQIILFGPNSMEFFSGAQINDTGFPYNRVTSATLGLLSRYAIAGHELGFAGKAILWVGGDLRVHMLKDGYAPQDVSPPDLDRLIARADSDDLEATCYVADGVPRWVLSSSDWTWEFNLNTQKWNERQSHLLARWRGTQAQYAFSQYLIGDTQSGNIHTIAGTTHKEDGDPLRFRVESAPVHKFPARVRVARADFNIAAGTGRTEGTQPIQTDPTIEISWSDDGSLWSNPLQRPMGPQARYEKRVTVTRSGLSGPQGRRWRVDVSDPVHVGLMGGDMSAELRR